MKWFFALNENPHSCDSFTKMIKVAVYTAREYTSLEPHFIYDGKDNDLTRWLEQKGVNIIPHRVSIYDALESLSRDLNRPVSSGAWLRIDLPQLVYAKGWDDEYVLYTDCDVMFISDVNVDLSSMTCRYFTVAPEMLIDNNIEMNTGVMLMNIPRLYHSFDGFQKFILRNLHNCASLTWDQSAYRGYYHLEWDNLNPEYNWKPYWGANPNAKIIHFHGPKPTQLEAARKDELTGLIKSLARGDYFRQAELWEEHLLAAEKTAPPGSYPITIGKRNVVGTRTNGFEKPGTPESHTQPDLPLDVSTGPSERCSKGDFYRDRDGKKDHSGWRDLKGDIIMQIYTQRNKFPLYLEAIDLFLSNKDFDAAALYLQIVIDLAPNSPDVLKLLGKYDYLRGNLARAERTFQLALNLAPEDPDILVSLGKLRFDMGQYDQALTYLQKALLANPEDQDAQTGVTLIKMRLEEEQ